MAALSYSNVGAFYNHHRQPELTVDPQDHEVATYHDQLLGYYDNHLPFSDSFLNNPLFEFGDTDEFFYSDSYNNLLPYFSSSPSDNLISLSPEIFPDLQQVDESYHCPKRQKTYADNNFCSSSGFAPSFFDGYVENSGPILFPELLPEVPAPVLLPKFDVSAAVVAAGFNGGTSNVESYSLKKPSGGGSLSAQSIAARERRRKITDKTQELGKLIPGGNKMNTAEMLQAASKYVKFLQAQIGVLQLMPSIDNERKENWHTNELQILASLTIQEKLYAQEKCLVPKEFLETVVNDQEIQSTPFITDEISPLLGTQQLN